MEVSPTLDPRFIITEALPSVPVVTSTTDSPPFIDAVIIDAVLSKISNTSATPETGLHHLESNTGQFRLTARYRHIVVLTSPV